MTHFTRMNLHENLYSWKTNHKRNNLLHVCGFFYSHFFKSFIVSVCILFIFFSNSLSFKMIFHLSFILSLHSAISYLIRNFYALKKIKSIHSWTGKTTYSIILHLKLRSNVSMLKVLFQHKSVFISYLSRFSVVQRIGKLMKWKEKTSERGMG